MEKFISDTGLDLSRRQDVAIMEKTTLCICISETEAQRYGSRIQAVYKRDNAWLSRSPSRLGLKPYGEPLLYITAKPWKLQKENKAMMELSLLPVNPCFGWEGDTTKGFGIDVIIDLIEQCPVRSISTK